MPVPENIGHMPHKIKVTGAGPKAWGTCSCGYWCSGSGLTLKPGRKAIAEDFTRHLAAMERARRFEDMNQGETVRLFEPAPTQMPGQLSF